MKERLQKLISAAGLASRRAAEELLRAGRVTVNGGAAALGESADSETDCICVDGKPLNFSTEKTYIMLHKPRGFVTTLSDEKGRHTVAELVQTGTRLYPVGRLDMYSEGLLLMTDDGALANALTHPSHEIEKVYRTRVRGDIAAALPVLTSAMELDGYKIRPAKVTQAAENLLDITIHEGRNRQVRKMCEAAGLKVERLVRIAEGPLRLDGLAVGQWRYLTKNEIDAIRNS